MSAAYEAVVCDLPSALLDSWSLWHRVAGSVEGGRRWRIAFLELIAAAAGDVGLPRGLAGELGRRWEELEPWPEVPGVLGRVDVPIAVVTNCSEGFGLRPAAKVGVELAAVASTERAGHYKPHPVIYARALSELGVAPERALYVAGAPYDVAGAHAAGMPVLWHDRARLGSDEDLPALAVIDSLDPLLDHLGQAR